MAIITGTVNNDTLSSTSADDEFTGGAGNDVFAFPDRRFGDDFITDFVQGQDKINLSALGIADLATLSPYIFEDVGGTVIGLTYGGLPETITIDGILPSQLTASDFIFNTATTAASPAATASNDVLFGGNGNDTLDGAGGDDELNGGPGADTLVGGSGDDTLRGGSGNDIFGYTARRFGDDVITDFVRGQDRINLSTFGIADLETLSPYISESLGSTVISLVYGGLSETITIDGIRPSQLTASDFIFNNATTATSPAATSSDDILFGGNGNDALDGAGGDDALNGGAGADTLVGGSGDDTLRGGSGSDIFGYTARRFGEDVILDFVQGQVRVGRWGGWVFINPDDKAEAFEDFLGDIDRHFQPIPFERRYKAVHVAKKLRCNWKVAQEAFMEAYHVVATHPTLLDVMGDANSKYDVFGNMSRAISPNGLLSPHVNPALVAEPLEGAKTYAKVRHALSGNVYERMSEDRVQVTARDGRTGTFDHQAHHIEGELDHADVQLCDWVGGKLPAGWELEEDHTTTGPVEDRRKAMANEARERWRQVLGDEVDAMSDAEFVDTIYYNLFPNISPWGCLNPIFYRFRPLGDNPEECIHETMFMMPVKKGEQRPAPSKVHWLDFDDDYCDAAELGMLAKVFNQDVVNLPHVQRGMKSIRSKEIVFANYGETKIRHFHQLLNEQLSR